MSAKKCLICNSAFSGRRDAKTCSVRCRKRLQLVKLSFIAVPAKKQLVKTLLLLVAGIVGFVSILGINLNHTSAATSSYLNFQARLLSASGNLVPDGNYNVEFKIYDSLASGGSSQGACSLNSSSDDCWWLETRTGANKVRVVNGYLTVNLGSVTAFGSSIPWDQPLYLSMNIGGTGSPGWDGEMSPRITLTALPYAFRAAVLAKTDGSSNVGTLSFGSVTNNPVLTLPNETGTLCSTGSVCTGYQAAGSYLTATTGVQLQATSPGTQQTGHFNISGVGIAGTALVVGNSADTNTALDIYDGGESATQTNFTQALTHGGINIQTDYTNGTYTPGIFWSTPNDNNTKPKAGIYMYQDGANGSSLLFGTSNSYSTGITNTALRLDANGQATFKNGTDSTAAFQVQKASGANILVVDSSNSKVGIGGAPLAGTYSLTVVGDSLTQGNLFATQNVYAGSSNGYLVGKTAGTGGVAQYDVVVLDASNGRVIDSTTPRDARVYGVANAIAANGSSVNVTISGTTPVNADATTTPIAIGDQLIVSSSSGRVVTDNNATTGILGTALSALASGTGTVNVNVHPQTGQYSPVFRNASDSTAAFQIQKSAGSDTLFTADTSNNKLVVGNSTGTDANTTLLVVDGASADPTTGYNGAIYYNSSTNKFRCYQNSAWTDCIPGTSGTLQTAYTASTGGTTPEIKVDSTRGAVDIQDADSTISGSLFTVRASNGGGGGLGSAILDVQSTGAISMTPTTASSTITIGSTSQTGTITLGQSTDTSTISIGSNNSLASGKTQTINLGTSTGSGSTTNVNIGSSIAGTTAITGATTITNRTSGSSDTLVVNNSTSTGTIAKFQDNGTSVFSLADGGAALFQNQTNSTNGFQVQNSGSAQLLNIDTTNTTLTSVLNANLVTNGSVEGSNGTTGWAADGASASVAQNSVEKYIGNNSLAVTTPATATRGAKFNLTTSTLAEGTSYTLTLSAKMAAGSSMSTFEMGYAADGSTHTSCLTGQTVTGIGWTTYTCTFTTTSVASTPFIYVNQTDATARTFYIDGVQLTRTSLLNNYSVEQALASTNWQAKGATTTRDTGTFFSGAASLKIVTAAANDGAKQNITLQDNTTYSLSFYAIGSGTAIATLEAGYSYDGTVGNETACITGQTVSTTAWTSYSCTFTTPASHSGTPYFYFKNTAATARTVFFDQILLTQGNTPAAYREGNIALNGVVNSPMAFQPQTDSTTSFQIQTSSGANLFQIDSQNSNVTILGNNTGMIQPWKTGNSTGFSGRDSMQKVIANGYIYIIGGVNSGGTAQTTVQYAKIQANGNVGNWSTTTALPSARVDGQAVYANGYIYITGGNTANSAATAVSTILYAKVNADGTLGNWVTSPNQLPAARYLHHSVVLNGYIYVIFGNNTSQAPQSTTYYAKLNADGSTGVWNTTTSSSGSYSGYGMATANGYIYMVGGVNRVIYARPNADGTITSWNETSVLPVTRSAPEVYILNGYLYVVGGNTNDANPTFATTWFAPLNSDGTTGTWSCQGPTSECVGSGGSGTPNNGVINDTALPSARVYAGRNGISANGYMYVIGGQGAGGAGGQTTVYYTSTSRMQVGGSLDLVGLSGENLSDAGGAGGALTAGNTKIVGSLEVQDSANFNSSVSVKDSLSVNGTFALQSSTNSQNAFQVENTNGVSIANVSTISLNQNLITNPGFESNTAGWSVIGGSTLTTNSTSQSGTQALNIATAATNPSGASYSFTYKSNTTYTLSFYARVSASSISVFEYGRTVGGSSTNCATGQTLNTGYLQFTCTFTTGTVTQPQTTDAIYFRKTGATTPVIYLDSVQLEMASANTNFTDQPTPNLVSNPDAESNANGWSAVGTGASVSSSDEQALFGKRSIKFVTGTQGGSNQGEVKYSYNFAPSSRYTLSFWARKDTGSAAFTAGRQDVSGTDATCTTTPDITSAGAVTTTWTQFTCTFTTGSTITPPSSITLKQTDTTSDNLYIDGVSLVQGGVAQGFVRGGENLQADPLNNTILLNQNSSGEVGQWQTNANALPAAKDAVGTVVYNGYIYAIGGYSGTAQVNTAYYAKLNSDGSTGAWGTTTPLPENKADFGIAAYNGYVYVFNGDNGSGTNQDRIYYAKVNPVDGTLGAWRQNTTSPGSSVELRATIANGIAYLVGGSSTEVYYAKVNADGSLGAWYDTINTTNVTKNNVVFVANGYIYNLAGDSADKSFCWYARINTDGSIGTWTALNSLPQGRQWVSGAVVNGYVYMIGGDNNSNIAQSTVYYAKLNSDGTIGNWNTAMNSLPAIREGQGTAVYNGYIYAIGGNSVGSGNNTTATVYYTSTSRLKVGGSLDLVGLNGQNLADGGSGGGGELTAGNTNVVGSLKVNDAATFNSSVTIEKELHVSSSVLIQNTTNQSNAFQVQNASGVNNIKVSTVNLVSNTTFETGYTNLDGNIDGWSKKLGTETSIKIQSSNAQFGSNSMELVTTNASTQQGAKYNFWFQASTQYTLSVYAKISSGTVSIFDLGRSENGSTTTNCLSAQSITTTYARYTCTFTTGATIGANGTPYIYIAKASTDGNIRTFYIDGVQLEAAGAATDYREGDLTVDGVVTVKSSANTTAVLQVQNASSVNQFTIDTTNARIYIGPTAGDTVGTILVLGNKTNSGDPTGVDGAMYFNSSMQRMRCYFDGQWRFCDDPVGLTWGVNIEEDFVGNSGYTQGYWGQLGWEEAVSSTTGANIIGAVPDLGYRPGQVQLETGTNAAGWANMYLVGVGVEPIIIGGNEEVEFAINIPTLADGTNDYDLRIGLNDTDGSADVADGLYFEYDRGTSTNWRYASANGGTRTKNTSSTAVATGWHRFKIKVNSAANSVTYYVDGVSLGTAITTNIPTTSGHETEPGFTIVKQAGTTNRTIKVDYFQYRQTLTTAR